MQPLSKQNPVAVDSAATGRVASPNPVLPASVGAPRVAGWFWAELHRLQERWDPARHRLHRRWAAGELSRGELAGYAEEHHQLLLATAEISRRAAANADGLLGFMLEEQAHREQEQVEHWRRFAQGVGWSQELSWCFAAEPAAATLECARCWRGETDRPLAHDLLTLYAVQRARAGLAEQQLAALMRYYGLSDGAAVEYFRLQLEADTPEAAVAQTAIEQSFTDTDPFVLLTQAEAVHRAHWHMLEAIEEDHHR